MADDTGASGKGTDAAQVGHGIAYVCTHLDQIRSALSHDPASKDGLAALKLLQSLPSGDEDIVGALDNLHRALLRKGDALGVYGHSTRGIANSPGMVSVPGLDRNRPLEIVYRCPAARCPRVEPGPTASPPLCGLSGQKLRRDRL